MALSCGTTLDEHLEQSTRIPGTIVTALRIWTAARGDPRSRVVRTTSTGALLHENQGDAPSSVEGVTDLNQHFSEVIKRVGDGTLDANDVHGILENILDSTSRRHDSEIAIDRFTAPSAQI